MTTRTMPSSPANAGVRSKAVQYPVVWSSFRARLQFGLDKTAGITSIFDAQVKSNSTLDNRTRSLGPTRRPNSATRRQKPKCTRFSNRLFLSSRHMPALSLPRQKPPLVLTRPRESANNAAWLSPSSETTKYYHVLALLQDLRLSPDPSS